MDVPWESDLINISFYQKAVSYVHFLLLYKICFNEREAKQAGKVNCLVIVYIGYLPFVFSSADKEYINLTLLVKNFCAVKKKVYKCKLFWLIVENKWKVNILFLVLLSLVKFDHWLCNIRILAKHLWFERICRAYASSQVVTPVNEGGVSSIALQVMLPRTLNEGEGGEESNLFPAKVFLSPSRSHIYLT